MTMRANEKPIENTANPPQEPQPSPAADSVTGSNAPADTAKPQAQAGSNAAAHTAQPTATTHHAPAEPAAPISREKRKISPLEQLLLPIALVIGILYDRLVFAPLTDDWYYFGALSGIFWLCYLVAFYAFFWKKIAKNRILWYIAGCSAALCLWNLVNLYVFGEWNSEFETLTILVIPCVLMAHTQFAAGNYKLKDAGKIALAWLRGWVIKPFTGLPALFEVTESLVSGGKSSTAKKAALGVGIALPLFCIILPLLAGADKVFGFYLKQMVGDFYIGSFIAHSFVAILAFGLFYSFLWNVGFGPKNKPAEKSASRLDPIVSCIVLGSVSLLYVLFCAVQFTYLFAGAGLPDGMTYSEYAREGFAQTVTVCALNLFIFGVFLQFGTRNKAVTGFLSALLGLTGIMLFSGFMRLWLYIDAYGLTWLRLLSAWFIIYLAVVIVLCAVRMLREKLPAIALCALILLGWYTVLGYANPDALVTRYNQSHNHDMVQRW